ncbi:hypothetical protein ACF1BQ_033170 [Bradyrhizobium sp. RDT10]
MIWSERVIVALPENHPLTAHNVVHWGELRHETILLSQHGPEPEFHMLLISKMGATDPCPVLRHDVALVRLLTLVGAGSGVLLALEGATGAAYPGFTIREVHDAEGPTRLSFRPYWR